MDCLISPMVSKLHATLTLGRVSNLPTIWTNCFAAWVLNRIGQNIPIFELPPSDNVEVLTFDLSQWVWILLGASLLYVSGTTLNDAFDEHYDRKYNSNRPIPSGILSATSVWLIGCLEMLGGAAILYFMAEVSAVYLVALCAVILAYDAVHKKWSGSVVLMGACRLFLWWTIASAGTDFGNSLSPLVYVWSIVLCFYIAGITFVARGEATGQYPSMPWPFLCLFAPVLVGFYFGISSQKWVAVFLVSCLAYLIYKGLKEARAKGPAIGKSVALWLALITLLDTVAVTFLAPAWGVSLILFFPLCLLMQRYFAAT